MALFTPQELGFWLQYPVEDGAAVMVEKVVAGWLRGATRLTVWPDPLPEVLFSWALELGGIAYENPTSQTDDQAREVRTTWADRRAQILASARGWADNPDAPASGPATRPSGAFPRAVPLPDPAAGCYPWGRPWPRG